MHSHARIVVLTCTVLPVRLGVQRLRTLQEKKAAQAKASRRDIAMLVEKGKIETARIKVENSKAQRHSLVASPVIHLPFVASHQ